MNEEPKKYCVTLTYRSIIEIEVSGSSASDAKQQAIECTTTDEIGDIAELLESEVDEIK